MTARRKPFVLQAREEADNLLREPRSTVGWFHNQNFKLLTIEHKDSACELLTIAGTGVRKHAPNSGTNDDARSRRVTRRRRCGSSPIIKAT